MLDVVILTDQFRGWLARSIRARVVGPQATRTASAIFDAPGPRLIPRDSPMRVVHADASMFIGGMRALLLQSLHPLAMAGVADHSDFRSDPWGRLQRTAEFVAATTYGPADVAARAVERVKRVHERVVGVAPDGRPYAANDPHLLAWVHVAEVDSFLAAYQRFGGGRLDTDDADTYVRHMGIIARELGVPDPPESVAALADELAAFRPELRGTRAARDAARYLLVQPPLPLAAYPAYLTIAAAAVSLMPACTRWPLRLPLLPISERLIVTPAGSAVTDVMRWAMTRRPARVS